MIILFVVVFFTAGSALSAGLIAFYFDTLTEAQDDLFDALLATFTVGIGVIYGLLSGYRLGSAHPSIHESLTAGSSRS